MWRELISSRQMSCCLFLVLCLFCFVSVSFFVVAFTEEAAALCSTVLRSSVCMRPDSHTQLHLSTSFSVFVHVAFSDYFCTITVFSLYGYVFSFRMVFFYLVTTGWVFDISLCENSINQSINQSRNYDHITKLSLSSALLYFFFLACALCY